MSKNTKSSKGFDALLAMREELPDLSPKWDESPEGAPATPPAAAEFVGPGHLPTPYEATTDDGPLSEVEREHLALCEAALENLRVAYWAAGKALQVVRDGRLYREDYATFDDYTEDRWEMGRRHADRLIEAWPLAEKLATAGIKANESQVRELLPLASEHGQDAALLVGQTVAESVAVVEGVRMTAAILKGAVAVIPPGPFDAEQAIAQIRAYLQGEQQPAPARTADRWEKTTAAVLAIQEPARMRRFVDEARQRPQEAQAFISQMRHLADLLEKAIESGT
ncbi:hypothetical protein [Nonomuraea rhodomycinica]|uniref:Uncharacterized protein n=1 Tax=Nonomuraea rhodomycinica TaxID=1712872 RepID=A0A7Y6IYY9_9ACTN|nr:hypothetical protein [Nonomuraea rhodomycinica]NUW46991.1 hypothetical protein [Nonomuraea rhodomycinica]